MAGRKRRISADVRKAYDEMKNKYIAAYEKLVCNDKISPGDSRRDEIIAEIKGIANAASTKDARKYIEWWGWRSQEAMDSFIRRARKLLNG